MHRRRILLAPVILLILASLACNFGLKSVETPAPPPPVSTQSVEELQKNLEKAYQEAQNSGQVNITVTESQLTSIVAFELEKQDITSVKDPQVYLRNGQVQVYGTLEGDVSATARVVFDVDVNAAGKPEFHAVSAKVGPLPIPEDILSQLETNLNQAFADQIESMAPNTHIDNIAIADGEMTITGHKE
jgi:uncharacterized protein YpmS